MSTLLPTKHTPPPFEFFVGYQQTGITITAVDYGGDTPNGKKWKGSEESPTIFLKNLRVLVADKNSKEKAFHFVGNAERFIY